MRNFKLLRVWIKGFDIATKSIKFTQTFPKTERYGLCQQINSAAISIPSNIAEGSSRTSEKDYHRFLEISLGSSFELETQLLLSESMSFGDNELRTNLLTDIDEEQKMLIGFMAKLKK